MDGFWQKAGQMMGKACGFVEEDFRRKLRQYPDAQVVSMYNKPDMSPQVRAIVAEEMRRRGL